VNPFLRSPSGLGTTVISLEKTEWEPNAPEPELRLVALYAAHSEGVKTWLSIEPIIPGVTYPEKIVQETKDYVDWYVLGAFNYYRQLSNLKKEDLQEWYNTHVKQAINLLESLNKDYYIKKELRRWIWLR